MHTPPTPPPGVDIAVTADGDAVTFAWAAYKPGSGRYARVLLALWVAGWLAGTAFLTHALLERGRAGNYVWLAAWVLGGAGGLYGLRNLLFPPRPEAVRLSPDRLDYDPGRGPDEGRSCADLPDGKVVPVTPAPAASVPKARIDRVGVDHVNGRERLFLDTPAGRMEIGGCLLASERAWLLAVLQEWLGAPARRPWSRPPGE